MDPIRELIKAVEQMPVVKHPGHANQKVHAGKGGGGGPAGSSGSGGDDVEYLDDSAGGGGTMDRKPNAEGTTVKVTGSVEGKGKKGVITYSNASGTFHNVEFSNGKSGSYSGSDLSPVEG